jgi:hypothetical protein
MRFFRHDGIYRSDVSSLLVNPVQLPPPVGRPRYRAIGRAGRNHTSCPSSAMSSGRLFLDRGGRHQSPSPLHRHCQNKAIAAFRQSEYHQTVDCVLTVCVSRGDKRKYHLRDSLPGFGRLCQILENRCRDWGSWNGERLSRVARGRYFIPSAAW